MTVCDFRVHTAWGGCRKEQEAVLYCWKATMDGTYTPESYKLAERPIKKGFYRIAVECTAEQSGYTIKDIDAVSLPPVSHKIINVGNMYSDFCLRFRSYFQLIRFCHVKKASIEKVQAAEGGGTRNHVIIAVVLQMWEEHLQVVEAEDVVQAPEADSAAPKLLGTLGYILAHNRALYRAKHPEVRLHTDKNTYMRQRGTVHLTQLTWHSQ